MADLEEAELAMEACDEDFFTDEQTLESEVSEEDQNKNEESKCEVVGNSGAGEVHATDQGAARGEETATVDLNRVSQNGSNAAEDEGSLSEVETFQHYPEGADLSKNEGTLRTDSKIPADTGGQNNVENGNGHRADFNSTLPESERAIEIDRTESEACAEPESLQESASNTVLVDSQVEPPNVDDQVVHVKALPVSSETVEADLKLTLSENQVESQTNESSASRNNMDLQGCDNVQTPNQNTHENDTNMHLPNSSPEVAAEQSPSLEIPSKCNTNSSSQNSNSQHRTTSNVDSEDDTLLSELDDLLHNKSSDDHILETKSSSVADLPNGLRLDSSDSKKLLMEMEVLRTKCSEQEHELKR